MDFEIVRSIDGLDAGASYKKLDLHVHSPLSHDTHKDWRDKTPRDLVAHALDAGLDAIAITDHNTAGWCDRVTKAADGKGLTIFPGVEITTDTGHLLAIFEPGYPSESIADLLISAGIPRAEHGSPDAQSSLRMEALAQVIEAAGGVAIAAHVDGPAGFLELAKTAKRRKAIYAAEAIRGFEVKLLENTEWLRDGSKSGYPRRVACIQGSDSYPARGSSNRIDAVGRRFTLMKLGELTIRALKQALADPTLRVRFMNDQPLQPEVVIQGVSASGGFLDGQVLRFSPEISALIGGTGTGKSLTIELIRLALDQQTPPVLTAISEEVASRLADAMGDSASVHVLIAKGADRYVVERLWHGPGEGDQSVFRVDGDTLVKLDEEVHLPTFFPIKAFSQGEVIEYAREPLARLSLLDDLLDLQAERSALKATESKLRENATALIQQHHLIEADESLLQQLPGIREGLGQLSKFFTADVVKRQSAWNEEQGIVDGFVESLDELIEDATTSLDELRRPLFGEPEVPTASPNPALIKRVLATQGRVTSIIDQRGASLLNDLDGVRVALGTLHAAWQSKHTKMEARLQALLVKADADGVGLVRLNTKLKKLQAEELNLSRIKDRVDSKLLPKLKALTAEREALLTALQAQRKAIRKKRRDKAEELTARLDEVVRIKIRQDAETRAIGEALRTLAKGSYLSDATLGAMEQLHPIRLVKSLLKSEFDTLAADTGLEPSHFEKLRAVVDARDRLDDLYDLQIMNPDDVVQIQFAVEDDRYKELEKLAHGQKCTVVLMVSMAEGRSPLIVDQPEDALHAPWIEKFIVSRLRSDRGMRQCIFATKSGNVLVSADAEQVIALNSDADSGWIERTGSIDSFEARDMILYHVEGGPDAFSRKKLKYDLDT